MANLDNSEDVIDSRDVIARIEELEGERDNFTLPHPDGGDDVEAPGEWAGLNPDDAAELATLTALADAAESASDWVHGESLIRESYFTDYIEELVKDCYETPKGMDSGAWPWRHMTMDWEAAADEAKADYDEVDFDGVTYLIRC
ncbi:hypothetical protein [Rhodanobacter sp. MP7CTX1]|uniref:hypothetical protein n=1 Tax=Rhodanobacter sp. MP7CTX1 TaxID=2723084 RepID=UPI001615AB0F|nr:hypothetical protein [Rhodanobacter sp. MP7CTX1]MBB6185758.1 GT2 family glycosyltransferase [Rhodanobacter sp. MP7CTX1]